MAEHDQNNSVPAYAAHLDERLYRYWSKNWKNFSYDLPWLKTPEDAAAFLMIAAVEADSKTPLYLTCNDGISIAPVAALSQYREDVAVPGMEIALISLFNMEAHGTNAFSNLVKAAACSSGLWTQKTVLQFLKLAPALPLEKMHHGAPTYQDPYDTAHYVVKIAEAHIDGHADDEAVKERLLDYCRQSVERADPAESRAELLAYGIVPVFEQFASDEDVAQFRGRFHKLTQLTPTSEFIADWRKHYPRIFGPRP